MNNDSWSFFSTGWFLYGLLNPWLNSPVTYLTQVIFYPKSKIFLAHMLVSTTVEIVSVVSLPKKFRNPTNASKLERPGAFPLKILKEKKQTFHISSKTARQDLMEESVSACF
jgi:hypothetical protein